MNPKYLKTLDEVYEVLKEFSDEIIREIFSLLKTYVNEKEKWLEQRVQELQDSINEEMRKRQS